VVVDVNESRVVDVGADHLWQEVAQQTNKAFYVLLAGEEDFLASNSRRPQLREHLALRFVEL